MNPGRTASIIGQSLYITSAFLALSWFTRQRLSFGRCHWEPIYISFFSGSVAAIQLSFDDATFVTFNVTQNDRSVPWWGCRRRNVLQLTIPPPLPPTPPSDVDEPAAFFTSVH